MSTLSHLHDALESLREAADSAGMGTELMIEPIIEDVERLYERTQNIDNGDDSE